MSKRLTTEKYNKVMSESIHLAVCPHCGSDVEIIISIPMYGTTGVKVKCRKCGIQTEVKSITTCIFEEDGPRIGSPVVPRSLMEGILTAVSNWNGKMQTERNADQK